MPSKREVLAPPTLTTADGEFIGALGSEELTDLEFRALLEASRHSRVDNARMREIAGLDTPARASCSEV